MTTRSRIGFVLLVAAGCNQVFGIKDTKELPDASDPMFTGRMNWIAPTGSGSATVEFPIGGEAVDSSPLKLEIGAGAGSGSDTLAPTTYNAQTGEFQLGFKLAGQAWRLVYTLPSESISHEYQWSVQTPDIVIPRMTRKGATPIPANSGYDIQPTPATTFSAPAIATGGAFTFNAVPASEINGGRLQYTASDNAVAISGPVSAPDPAADWILVTDSGAYSPTLYGVTAWGVTQPTAANPAPLVANMLTPLTPTWHMTGLVQIRPNVSTTTASMLLHDALHALGQDDSTGNPLTTYGHLSYGYAPSMVVYGFHDAPLACGTAAPAGQKDYGGTDCLGAPDLITLADDRAFDTMLMVPNIPELGLTPVLYARMTLPREVHGVALASSIQSMVAAPQVATQNETIDIFGSNLASAVLVDTVRLDSADLSGATGPVAPDVMVAKGDQPRLLTFNPRLGADGALQARADDYEITLWEIQFPDTAGAKLHAVRIYHVLDASHGVYIEGSQLKTGSLYVFSVTTRVGFPMAGAGNYRVIQYPLGESTVFSRQFIVQ